MITQVFFVKVEVVGPCLVPAVKFPGISKYECYLKMSEKLNSDSLMFVYNEKKIRIKNHAIEVLGMNKILHRKKQVPENIEFVADLEF